MFNIWEYPRPLPKKAGSLSQLHKCGPRDFLEVSGSLWQYPLKSAVPEFGCRRRQGHAKAPKCFLDDVSAFPCCMFSDVFSHVHQVISFATNDTPRTQATADYLHHLFPKYWCIGCDRDVEYQLEILHLLPYMLNNRYVSLEKRRTKWLMSITTPTFLLRQSGLESLHIPDGGKR